MGFTRACRYANYKGRKKYDKEQNYELLERGTSEDEKAKATLVFFKFWKEAGVNEVYH